MPKLCGICVSLDVAPKAWEWGEMGSEVATSQRALVQQINSSASKYVM